MLEELQDKLTMKSLMEALNDNSNTIWKEDSLISDINDENFMLRGSKSIDTILERTNKLGSTDTKSDSYMMSASSSDHSHFIDHCFDKQLRLDAGSSHLMLLVNESSIEKTLSTKMKDILMSIMTVKANRTAESLIVLVVPEKNCTYFSVNFIDRATGFLIKSLRLTQIELNCVHVSRILDNSLLVVTAGQIAPDSIEIL